MLTRGRAPGRATVGVALVRAERSRSDRSLLARQPVAVQAVRGVF
jgi:hypothetical protein